MVLSLGSYPKLDWRLKTIFENPTVAVNDTNQVSQAKIYVTFFAYLQNFVYSERFTAHHFLK